MEQQELTQEQMEEVEKWAEIIKASMRENGKAIWGKIGAPLESILAQVYATGFLAGLATGSQEGSGADNP